MKDFLKKVLYAVRVFFGVSFALAAVGGIIMGVQEKQWAYYLMSALLLALAFLLIHRRKPKAADQPLVLTQPVEPVDAYVNTGRGIYRTDGKPISDREVPYLIESGLQEALASPPSLNPKFSRSADDQELMYQFISHYGGTSQRKVDQFLDLAHQAWEESDLDEKIKLQTAALLKYNEVRLWHYEKSRGAALWFQDMYEHMHNSQNPDFSWDETERAYLKELLLEREHIRPKAIEMAQQGFLQKDFFAMFSPEEKSVAKVTLKRLESEGCITKTKKGNTYWVEKKSAGEG